MKDLLAPLAPLALAVLAAGCDLGSDPELSASINGGGVYYEPTTFFSASVFELDGVDLSYPELEIEWLLDGTVIAREAPLLLHEKVGYQDLSIEVDLESLTVGEHELTFRAWTEDGRDVETSTSFETRDAVRMESFQLTSGIDDGFKGGTELEMHMYDPSSGQFLGCTPVAEGQWPVLLRPNGQVVELADLGQSLQLVFIEDDDGSPCPSEQGTASSWGDTDDWLGSVTATREQIIEGVTLEDGIVRVTLGEGRGY